ncbi:MAG: cytochrome C oxidase subunit IV family protein [Bacteroidota bacterium]
MADQTHTEGHDEHTGHGGHHVFDKRTLWVTFIVLVVLTVVTVLLAFAERGFMDIPGVGILPFPELHLGWLSVPVTLAIAGTKAYWVASKFMGLEHDRGTNVLVFIGSSVFLVIFFGFTWLDFAFRDTFEAQSAVPADILEEEVRAAEAESEAFADEFEAVPLVVDDPDAELFGTPPTSAPAMDAAPTE